MADEKKLYDLRVGKRVFRNVSAAVIIKNIRNSKLTPEHEISSAGADQWIELRNVPELRRFFGGETDQKGAVNTSLFDVRYSAGSELESGLTRTQIIEKIRQGDINESDQVRQQGGSIWTLAGDMQSLQRFFEQRRAILRERGTRGLPRDTGIPFYRDLATPFAFFTEGGFLFNLAAVIIAFTIAAFVQIPLIAGPINILTTFYLYAYFFRTLSHAASGKVSFPDMVDFSDFMGELVRPGIQFFLSRAYALIPLLAYLSLWIMRGWDIFIQQPYLMAVLMLPWSVLILPFPKPIDAASMFDSLMMQLQSPEPNTFDSEMQFDTMMENYFQYLTFDIIVWACLFIFVLYFAIALMRQAAYGQFLPPINLYAVFLSVTRAPGPFMALVGILVALDLITIVATIASLFAFSLSYGMSAGLYNIDPANPVVAHFSIIGISMVIKAIEIIVTFIKMYFLGRFVWQYSEQMGWD